VSCHCKRDAVCWISNHLQTANGVGFSEKSERPGPFSFDIDAARPYYLRVSSSHCSQRAGFSEKSENFQKKLKKPSAFFI
jgi:hypothetical protein